MIVYNMPISKATILLSIDDSVSLYLQSLTHLFQAMAVLSYVVGRSVFRKRTLHCEVFSHIIFNVGEVTS